MNICLMKSNDCCSFAVHTTLIPSRTKVCYLDVRNLVVTLQDQQRDMPRNKSSCLPTLVEKGGLESLFAIIASWSSLRGRRNGVLLSLRQCLEQQPSNIGGITIHS